RLSTKPLNGGFEVLQRDAHKLAREILVRKVRQGQGGVPVTGEQGGRWLVEPTARAAQCDDGRVRTRTRRLEKRADHTLLADVAHSDSVRHDKTLHASRG